MPIRWLEFLWAPGRRGTQFRTIAFFFRIASITVRATLSQSHSRVFFAPFPAQRQAGITCGQLKSALAGETGIRSTKSRYIAEDSSIAGPKLAPIGRPNASARTEII